MDADILLMTIKIALGGFIAFLAILTMSKTRQASWMFLVAGILLSYMVQVYELLLFLGIFPAPDIKFYGIPVVDTLMYCVPCLFFVIAFVIKLLKK